MIFVIMPLGKAARQIWAWLLQVAVYVLASTLGGALTGLVLGWLGGLLGLGGAWPALLLALPALAYALHELGIIRLPRPNRAWQVPNTWLRRSPLAGTLAFGLILGSGLFTFIEFGSFYVLLLWEAALALPLAGALLGAIFGLARGLPALLGGLTRLLGKDAINLNLWILGDAARALHLFDGLLLLFVAGFLSGGLL